MDKEKPNFYCKFLTDEDNRLDYVFHHLRYDKIKADVKSNLFIDLNSLIIPNSIHQGFGGVGKETGEILYINTENLDLSGFVNSDEIKYIDDAPQNRFLQLNDILISRSRKVGICCIVNDEFVNSVCGSYIFFFKPKTDVVVPLFLVKFINSDIGQSQIEYLQTGSSGNNININEVKSIRIPNIPKENQQEILDRIKPLEVEISILDNKISQSLQQRDRILFSELGLKMPPTTNFAYFYSYPTDERLSFGIHHPDSKALDNALTNSKYEPRSLNEFISLHYDSVETSKTMSDSIFTYIGLEDIENGSGRLASSKQLFGKDILSKSLIFKKGQLMFSRLRPYLNKTFILEQHDEAIGSAELFVCSSKENVSLPLIKYYLLSEITLRQIKWILSGSSYPRLDEKDFLNIKIILPDDENEQAEIVKKIVRHESEILILRSEVEKKKKLMRALFNELLTDSLEC